MNKRLKDMRQKLNFYKDILYHYFRYGRFYKIGSRANGYGSIPKVIHYCWFGKGEKSADIEKCMETWHKVLPEYDIVLWNEENFPFDKYPFALQALKDKKWAYVSDVARLHALYYYGGIYMDTDVEVLKPLDLFLKHGFFSGYESIRHIPTGLMGGKAFNEYVGMLLKWYEGRTYGTDYYEIANTRIITRITRLCCNLKRDDKLFEFNDCCFYPSEFFCPKRNNDGWDVTNNTYAIHHMTGSWG